MTSMTPPLPSLRTLYVPSTLPTAVPAGSIPSQLPVLRVFGTTTSRQKICVNVHLSYPYFYVPFPMDSLDPLRPERVIRLCQRFAVSLNHAMCLALRQNPTGPSAHANYAGGTDPRHLHVLSVVLVKGIPFYGYHVGYSYWLKVSLANPSRVRVAVEQLHKPVVLGKVWQPHEAHLSHVLQCMCDFDLYGCGWLDLSGGLYREPIPEGEDDDAPDWISRRTIPGAMLYSENLSPARDTHTTLELDVLPHQILNRHRLQQRCLHQDFVELLYQPLHPEEKLVPAMRELWEDERRRRLAKGLSTNESAMLPVSGGGQNRSMEELGYKVDGVEVDNKGGDWKISDELWDMLEQRMAAERRRRGTKLTFDQFSRALAAGANGERRKYDRWIMTAFEAISAHWPKAVRTQRTPRTQRTQKSDAVQPLSSQTALISSQVAPSSPPPPLPQEVVEDIEEDNPFEIFTTQASQEERVEAEVDADEVQEAQLNDEDEDVEERQHEQAARLKAQEGQRLRATQAAKGAGYEEDFDLLFREAVQGGETPTTSRATTPSRTRGSTVMGTGSTGRREARHRQIAEQAGFGDLR